MYTEYAMTMMRLVREQVPGYKSSVYNAYIRFLDDKYRELSESSGAYPTIESKIMNEPPNLPAVTEAYSHYLLLKDAKIAAELAFRKQENRYNFAFLKDPVSASKEAVKFSVDNLSAFRDKMRRHVIVSGNPYLTFSESAPKGYFYGASLMVRDIPDQMPAGLLADGPRFNFDVATITTQQVNTGAKRRYTGRLGQSEQAETAGLRRHVSMAKLTTKYAALSAAAYFDPVRYVKQRDGMDLLIRNLKYGNTNLLYANIIYSFYEAEKADLDARIYDFMVQMQDLGVSLEWLPDVQANLYQYGMPAFRFAKSNPTAKQTMGIAYPFKSSEILHYDSPTAVHIGYNVDTKAPVIVDISRGTADKNGWIFGRIGVGKSILEKHMLEEMAEKHLNAGIPFHFIGLDMGKQQEHRYLAERMGIPFLTLDGGAGLGDIMNYGAAHASAVLNKLFELDYELSNLLYPSLQYMEANKAPISRILDILEQKKGDVDEHRRGPYARLTEAIHAKMDEFRYLFEGPPLPKGNFIFGTHSKQLHEKASVAAAYVVILKALEHFHQLPLSDNKILFVEEAHRLLSDPLTRNILAKAYLEERKYTVGIWCITQEAAHVVSSEDTKQMLNNSAWKIVFQTDGAELLQEPLGLSNAVVDKLKTSNQLNQLRKGFCLIKQDEKQLLVQTQIPAERMKVYNTDFRQLATTTSTV